MTSPTPQTMTDAEIRILLSENKALRRMANDALNALVDVPLDSMLDRLPDAARARADHYRLTAELAALRDAMEADRG